MLVIARSAGQSIVLDERITITVLASRSGLVRLGIEAPEGFGVRRGELGLLPEVRRPRRRRAVRTEAPDAGEAAEPAERDTA
jgi:carbon storage regulator CsrA